ncbi:MAG: biliverdin-producing heme oxygenase [Aliidiomarina sp.]|uniref:biliverdin-producing heme oxygenase n=1 Tax=Aliidiomarina sp. TaxID=1872439 RepID=UPI0025BEDF25|nr:biliverdin-producing heme oxygenase [Aliidiomarina sp.]MCH8501140.1 biliverdin-producing heme oxygenase [Aliidiomarina sp.]
MTTAIDELNKPSLALMLRQATAQAHKNLEQAPLLSRLLHHDLSKDEYAQVIQRFYVFYQPLEPILHDIAPYSYHSRSVCLLRDLTELQHPTPVVHCSRFAEYLAQLPEQEKELAAFATLYVVEGSTNGGKIISQRLQRINPRFGVHFFNLWQQSPSGWQAWRHWSAELEQKVDLNQLKNRDLDFIIAHANATFTELMHLFQSEKI